MAYKSFKDLEAWKKARRLVTTIYKLSKLFPKDEMFVLTAQIRKAAISVPSNIAEGNGRKTRKDSLYFRHVARASLNEIETQVYLAVDLDYVTEKRIESVIEEIEETRKVLSGYINYLEEADLR